MGAAHALPRPQPARRTSGYHKLIADMTHTPVRTQSGAGSMVAQLPSIAASGAKDLVGG